MGLIIGLYILLQPISPFASQSSQPAGPTPTLDMTAHMPGTTMRDFMKQACQTAFYHQRASLTSEQYETGCDLEGNRLIAAYPAAISYCAENDVKSIGTFMDCLKRRQIGFLFSTVTNLVVAVPPTSVPAYAAPASVPSVPSRRPRNCADAVSMGLSEQQAGAYYHLDRDHDGVACYGD